MLVDVTLEQISGAIKIAEINTSAIYRDIQTLIKNGYISVYRKASKGTPPIYKIVKSEKMWKPNENQVEIKRKPKDSNINRCNGLGENQTKAKRKPSESTIKEKEKEINIYSRVITRLNELTGKNYRYTTKKTKTLIDARLKEGFIENDFYKVVEIKCKEWLNSEMDIYLRPETLFGNKFEGYLNQNQKQQIMEQAKGKILDMKIGGE